MRLFLALMAVAMLTVAIGCETADKAAEPAKSETPAAAKTAEPADDSTSDDNAVVADTSEMQEVSLKLPGMT